jgi:N6-L-threonylcarbamoyladenine synthase
MASLLVGVNTAQALAYIQKKPLIPTHHIAGHIYGNFLERDEIQFPIVVLTVSGGHNELVLMKGHHDFEPIGETLDDAAGEAFDKVARLLGLGYPGGPIISKRAESGNPKAFKFPRPMLSGKNEYNFSFSGLKSAVRREVSLLSESEDGHPPPSESEVAPPRLSDKIINDLAASFQAAVIDVLADKLIKAALKYGVKEVHLAGGVSANKLLRSEVRRKLPSAIDLKYPVSFTYCTDNAAMIAGAAYFMPPKKRDAKRVEVFSQRALM